MDNRLAQLYRGVAVHATEDDEHQAALELLALVMLSDADISDDEITVVREVSEQWRDADFPFEDYLRPAIESARRAYTNDGVGAFLESIDERISSRVLRNALFSAAREVAGVDHDVTAVENSILAQVAVRFG